MVTADLLGPVRFTGTVSRDEDEVAVAFDARIDHCGVLVLVFEPVPVTRSSLRLQPSGDIGKRLTNLALRGIGPHGETIDSESLQLQSVDSRSTSGSASLRYNGSCAEARIRRSTEAAAEKPQLVWWFRRLRTFSGLLHEIAGGRIWFGGGSDHEDSQTLTGRAVVEPHDSAVARPAWRVTSERALEHVTRVMSFAVGTYLRPYVELHVDGPSQDIRVCRWPMTAPLTLAPFHFLDLAPIFRRACESYPNSYESMRARDAAIQWLLAGASYHEVRLVAAMTALENILDVSGEADDLLSRADFEWLEQKVRRLIEERDLPDEVLPKLKELSRRSFRSKLRRFIDSRNVFVEDFPRRWDHALITARNGIVHRGLYHHDESESTQDIWEHIVVARELITRILLTDLEFQGNYSSALHGGAMLSFPSCRRP